MFQQPIYVPANNGMFRIAILLPCSQRHRVARSGAGVPLVCRGAGADQRAVSGEDAARAAYRVHIGPICPAHIPFLAGRIVRYAVAGFELCHVSVSLLCVTGGP